MACEELRFLDVERLIEEVKKRPHIYDCSAPEYGERMKKNKHWAEICSLLFSNWNDLPAANKNVYINDVRKRWRSMRDSFVKDYRKLKTKSAIKKRKYLYFDQLSFLIPAFESRGISQSHSRISQENEDSNDRLGLLEVDFTVPSEDLNASNKLSVKPLRKETESIQNHPEVHTSTPDVAPRSTVVQMTPMEVSAYPEEDEDRLFLLSLLPTFKKLDDDTKFNARIEIMQVLRQSLYNRQSSFGYEHNAADVKYDENT